MVELHWCKSSFSEDGGNNCIEVAATNEGVILRESEDPAHTLTARRAAFRALLGSIKTAREPSTGQGAYVATPPATVTSSLTT